MNETAEKIADSVRAHLLQELRNVLQEGLDVQEYRIPAIESAAHVLNSLDPARAGSLTGSYATLRAERIEEPAK